MQEKEKKGYKAEIIEYISLLIDVFLHLLQYF